jgi:Flp pilus assembly protein TadG
MTTGASTSSPTPATASPLPAWVKRTHARAAAEDGVAMVEFALVATVLTLLVFGITQFGLALNAANDETQLAGEVARYAAVNYNPATGGQSLQAWAKAQGNPTLSSSSTTKICISFPNTTSNIGDPVKVVVSTDFKWVPLDRISRLAGGAIPATSTISSQAVMRLEAPPTAYSPICV